MNNAYMKETKLALTDLNKHFKRQSERLDSLELVENSFFFSVSLHFYCNIPLVISFIFLLLDGQDVKTRSCNAEKRFEEMLLITNQVIRRSV